MHTLLEGRDPVTGKKLPEKNAVRQIITFLVAGHETVAATISYAIYEISKNKTIEKKIREEIKNTIGMDHKKHPTAQQIEQLSYLGRVINETLRLHAPVVIIQRMVSQDHIILNKYKVHKGEMIEILLRSLHRNPKYWHDPERFDPDRFLPKEIAKRHPHCYHPFGIGMRSCIGTQFALFEAKLMLARIYQRFSPHLVNPDEKLQHLYSLVARPYRLQMRFEPLKKHPPTKTKKN